MSDNSVGSKYTVEDYQGVWFQLWWNGDECIYSEDLQAHSRDDAEKEAANIAEASSPLDRVMHDLGCESIRNEAGDHR
jgi:hypothetical protein